MFSISYGDSTTLQPQAVFWPVPILTTAPKQGQGVRTDTGKPSAPPCTRHSLACGSIPRALGTAGCCHSPSAITRFIFFSRRAEILIYVKVTGPQGFQQPPCHDESQTNGSTGQHKDLLSNRDHFQDHAE